MSYDHWKTTDPGAEFLGPDPDDEEPTIIMSKSFTSFKDIGGRLVPVTVNFEYPPIPIRSCDWRAWYSEDQSDNPDCGWGATPDDAIQDLVDSYEDPEQPVDFAYAYECDLIAERGQVQRLRIPLFSGGTQMSDWILLIISPLLLLCVVGLLSLFGGIAIGVLDDIYEMIRRRDFGPLKRFAGFCGFLALIAGLWKAGSYLPANLVAAGVIVIAGICVLGMLIGLLIGCVGLWKEGRK